MPAGPFASEDDILDTLGRYFPLRKPGVLVGRGDDCALLPAGKPLSISSDLFLEDVHFRSSYATAEEIGHKALACNISDLAACGSKPLAFTLNLGLPKNIDPTWLNNFFAGMGSLASRYGMALKGREAACVRHGLWRSGGGRGLSLQGRVPAGRCHLRRGCPGPCEGRAL